jgi:phosphohistidine phosphatase
LVVGHNPGFEDCAALLINPGEALDRTFVGEKFPTSALLVLNFDIGAWKELAPHIGAVVDFIRPKDLPD